jgi:hypothetical protein
MKVTGILEGTNGEETPMVWSSNTDELGAMLCVAQLLQHARDEVPHASIKRIEIIL